MENISEKTHPTADEEIVSCLLGELSADAVERLETEVFLDPEFADRVFMVESELVEDYVWGRLPPERRLRFEQNYLVTDSRVERVRFASTFRRQLNDPLSARSTRPPLWEVVFRWLAFPALGLLLLYVSVAALRKWVVRKIPVDMADITRGANPTPSPAATGFATPTPVPSLLSNASPQMTTALSPRESVSIRLLPDSNTLGSGGGLPELKLLPQTTNVELRLIIVAKDFSSYQATVTTPEGVKTWSGISRQARANAEGAYEVIFRVPPAKLRRGENILDLTGTPNENSSRRDPIGQYVFRVISP